MGSGAKNLAIGKKGRKGKSTEDGPVSSTLQDETTPSGAAQTEPGELEPGSDAESGTSNDRDSVVEKQGEEAAEQLAASGSNHQEGGVVPMEVDRPTPATDGPPRGPASLTLSGNATAATTALGGMVPASAVEALVAEVASLRAKVEAVEAGSGERDHNGNLFDSMQNKSLQRRAEASTFNGEGSDTGAYKRIRDFLDRHYAFLDNTPADQDQRHGRKFVSYLSRHLEGAAKDWFGALPYAEVPASRQQFETMLRDRFESNISRESIMAQLNQLTCRNYSAYLSSFNKLTGELRATDNDRRPFDEDEIRRYFRDGLQRGGDFWSQLMRTVFGQFPTASLQQLQSTASQVLTSWGCDNGGDYLPVMGKGKGPISGPGPSNQGSKTGGGKAAKASVAATCLQQWQQQQQHPAR